MKQIRRARRTRFGPLIVCIVLALPGTAGSADAQTSSTPEVNPGAVSSDSAGILPGLRPSGRFASLERSYPLLLTLPHVAHETAVTVDTLHLETLRGKIVLLDFWASWCAPCIEKIPETNAFADEFAHRDDFVFISVNQDALTGGGDLDYVRSFVGERRIRYPVLIDAAAPSLKKAFNIRAWPTRILISQDGEMLTKTAGRLTLSDVADYLRVQ